MFEVSCVYKWNIQSTKDIVVNQGGTSSGKTYSIIQVLFTKCVNEPGVTCTVVGQDIPNLKVGALKDALDIYNNSSELKTLVSDYNKSDRVFTFFNNSKLEFKSYDSPQDAKSGKRDYLFINEANGINFGKAKHFTYSQRVLINYEYRALGCHENYVLSHCL
jgi:phage terminase large subunit